MKEVVLGLIRFYQRGFSSFTAPSCRYLPTCSEYGYEAIQRHGLIRGSLMALRRITRCHPWSPGGFDPVP